MPEYTAIAAQTVAANQNVIFTEAPIPCTKGLVTHRAGSGLFNLRGNCSQCRVRYKVDFIGAFFNVAASEYVDVTKGCCASLSIRNVSGEAIDVSNANLIITRVC